MCKYLPDCTLLGHVPAFRGASLTLDQSSLVPVALRGSCSGYWSKGTSAEPQSCMLSSRTFIVLGCTFRTMIGSDLVYYVR